MPALLIRTPVVRLPSLRPRQAGYPSAKARISQVGTLTGYSYLFPYAPVQVRFDSVGSEYQEVERPGNYSLVIRKKPNLLKVAFDFRVAHRPSNGQQPIANDLAVLKKLATDDIPVVVTGLNGYFVSGSGTALTAKKFRITNLSVDIVTLSPENQPWQANCSIELLEDRNPSITVVKFSAIKYPVAPPKKTTSSKGSGNKPSGNSNNTAAPLNNYSTQPPPPGRPGYSPGVVQRW